MINKIRHELFCIKWLLKKQKVEKYKAEVQDYGERLGKEVQK